MRFYLTIVVFSFCIFSITSCKKQNTQEFITDNLNHTTYGTGYCPPATVNVDAFDMINQMPDAPLDPVTTGTSVEIAKNNYQRIQWCLKKYKRALLNAGEFVINKTLMLDTATLISANVGVSWPVIKMGTPYNGDVNGVVKIYNNSRMAFVIVNGNKFSFGKTVPAVVSMLGNNSKVDNSWIMGDANLLQKANEEEITGLYILCGNTNTVQNNQIVNNHHGVIVFNENANVTTNILDQNKIFNNRCCGITLRNYAKVTNNKIYLNGWDCKNNISDSAHPVPGAGIYSENNPEGSYISGNEIYDNNGHNIDLINGKKFSILSNTLYNPGNKYFPGCGYTGGIAPVYGSAFSMSCVNIAYSTIDGNNVRNENRNYNSVGTGYFGVDKNGFFSTKNGVKFSDLPFGSSSVIAFCLAETDSATFAMYHTEQMVQVKQNVIRNNIFIASPSGIGYFSSRNTGFENNQYWSAATTNYFTLNNPTGSNHGSVRCGGNWYAANNVDHNTDDSQHIPPGSNWTGSDNKNFY
jgi:hypothetical protein